MPAIGIRQIAWLSSYLICWLVGHSLVGCLPLCGRSPKIPRNINLLGAPLRNASAPLGGKSTD